MNNPKKAIDPSDLMNLIFLVIKILMEILKTPQAVSDHLTGKDLWLVQKPFVMPGRWREVRGMLGPYMRGPVAHTNQVESAVIAALKDMTPGMVYAHWSEGSVGREDS